MTENEKKHKSRAAPQVMMKRPCYLVLDYFLCERGCYYYLEDLVETKNRMLVRTNAIHLVCRQCRKT